MDKTARMVLVKMKDAEDKAWASLAGYKFWMFGYHAARWVNYNNLLKDCGHPGRPSPFSDLVKLARGKRG